MTFRSIAVEGCGGGSVGEGFSEDDAPSPSLAPLLSLDAVPFLAPLSGFSGAAFPAVALSPLLGADVGFGVGVGVGVGFGSGAGSPPIETGVAAPRFVAGAIAAT